MGIQKTRMAGQVSLYGIKSIGKGSGDKSAYSFQNTFQEKFNEYYRNRAAALFDEISAQGSIIVERADINEFEKYRRLIGELLNEVVSNAYSVNSEHILDLSGRQRIYTTLKIIDSKLQSLASDLLGRNSDKIDYLCRIDEIRGLVMDMLT